MKLGKSRAGRWVIHADELIAVWLEENRGTAVGSKVLGVTGLRGPRLALSRFEVAAEAMIESKSFEPIVNS